MGKCGERELANGQNTLNRFQMMGYSLHICRICLTGYFSTVLVCLCVLSQSYNDWNCTKQACRTVIKTAECTLNTAFRTDDFAWHWCIPKH